MSTSAGNFGRPKCGVWKYFKFDEEYLYCKSEISRADSLVIKVLMESSQPI